MPQLIDKAAGTEDLISSIGNTPLLRLRSLSRGLPDGVEVLVKAEHLNPGGSVKDRAALSMILDGVHSGRLTREKIIIDATSGNTGIAYAMIGACLGYRVALCLPKNASIERKRVLQAYGAELIETDPLQATDGAQIAARDLVAKEPEKYFYPDQYNNDANWRAHYVTTGKEIWEQTDGRVTHFLAGLGTSGTFTGVIKRLKEFNPKVRGIAMQPDSPIHGLEGMKHMESAIVPGIYDSHLPDTIVEVSTEDAQETMKRLALEEGLFVGVTAGANLFASLRLARTLPAGSVVVTVLCDAGWRYLSEGFWD
jgi:S-sulfo-L-cysteine synthase (O-acetyl-L-serine-dependent)